MLYRFFNDIGTPVLRVPELCDNIVAADDLIRQVDQVTSPDSALAQDLLRRADEFGTIKPPDGQVLLANVGSRSRLSVMSDKGVWLPQQANSHGILLADRLVPIDEPTTLANAADSIRWQFGTVACYASSYTPEGPRPLRQEPLRVHLGRTGLTNIRVYPIDELADIQETFYPLSVHFGDDRLQTTE